MKFLIAVTLMVAVLTVRCIMDAVGFVCVPESESIPHSDQSSEPSNLWWRQNVSRLFSKQESSFSQ